MKHIGRFVVIIIIGFAFFVFGQDKAGRIYWGDDVPEGWNGSWPAEFQVVPEKTNYERTTSSYQVHEFIDELKWHSENMFVFQMFITDLRKVCPAVVMANPRITSPEEARESGKPVIYLQGNIHPPEAEGKEAILMVMRNILLGDQKHLLDNQIIICCPNFNPDGNDTWATRDGTPHIIGTRHDASDYDLNRDAVKLETTNVRGLYQNVLNTWDPVLLFDAHAMGRVKHGYAIVYATSTVPAAHPEPRGYVWETLFPALRTSVRKNYGLEIFSHCLFDEQNWPPTVWSHDLAWWTVEGKFVANAYGLRNRMSILVETPGHPSFERKIYAQYAFIMELLKYTNREGGEMLRICREADADVVHRIRTKGASGQLTNYVEGKYESWGKIDLLAYPKNEAEYIPGKSVRQTVPGMAEGPPDVCQGVDHLAKPVGTKEATVPRGYLIPGELKSIVDRLVVHGIQIDTLNRPTVFSGEEYVIDKRVRTKKGGYDMTRLEGGFLQSQRKEFPAGTVRIDMAQPRANMIFYCLEPEVGDGFVGWNLFNDYLDSLDVEKHSVVYPVFKYLKIHDTESP